jgi:hypothetical protein
MRAILAIIGAILFSTAGYSQTLDLQAMCAAQARKAFQEWEREGREADKRFKKETISNDHQSHYNTKLKKCLVLIESNNQSGPQFSNHAFLMDAFERRLYAAYHWISKQDKKYWEVPPFTCELVPSLRNKKNCTTREEFDAFVAEYMEE